MHRLHGVGMGKPLQAVGKGQAHPAGMATPNCKEFLFCFQKLRHGEPVDPEPAPQCRGARSELPSSTATAIPTAERINNQPIGEQIFLAAIPDVVETSHDTHVLHVEEGRSARHENSDRSPIVLPERRDRALGGMSLPTTSSDVKSRERDYAQREGTMPRLERRQRPPGTNPRFGCRCRAACDDEMGKDGFSHISGILIYGGWII